MKNKYGFTLVELMVTLVLLGIVATIAIPSFNNMVVNSRLTTQSNDLIGAINFARSEAIKQNRAVAFCRVAALGDAVCATGTNWENWSIVSGGNVIRAGRIHDHNGTMIVRSDFTNSTVTFAANGLASTGASLVSGEGLVVCSTEGSAMNRRLIVLGAGSRVSLESEAGTCP